jgi:hypothetical protein
MLYFWNSADVSDEHFAFIFVFQENVQMWNKEQENKFCFWERSMDLQRTTKRYIRKSRNLLNHSCEDLKFCMMDIRYGSWEGSSPDVSLRIGIHTPNGFSDVAALRDHTATSTYLLTELSPSWGAANCAATQELPSILWNPKFQNRVHKNPPLVPNLSHIDPIDTIPFYLSKIHFNIVHPLAS